MNIVQWYGIALAALAAIVVVASHLRPLLPFWLLRHVLYPRLHPLISGTGDYTRFGAIVLGVFVTGNVLCGGIGIETSSDLVKRTGQLFIMNSIPLFLGGKIGPLVNILHIQYEDFARAHRWLGRVAAVHAVVHVTVAASAKHEFRSLTQLAGLIVGRPLVTEVTSAHQTNQAASSLCTILLLSVGVVWRLKYELFAKLHVALAVLTVITTWLHIASGSIFYPPEVYMLAACCTYDASFFNSSSIVGAQAASPVQLSVRWDEDRLFLLVETKIGFTASLFTENTPLLQERGTGKDKEAAVRAIVEGPFGKSMDLQSYSTIALFATGIGIVTHLSYLRKWLKDLQGSFKVITQSITLFWEVEAEAHIYWVRDDMDGLLEMDVKHMLRIHVFVKGEYISPNRRRGDTVTSDKVNLAMPNRIFIHFDSINAKNEINNLLQKSDRRTANSDGRTAIAVCSDSLTTAIIRREVCRTVRKDIILKVLDIVPVRGQTYGTPFHDLFTSGWKRIKSKWSQSSPKGENV
ncbi:hypothetical protein COCCADRAFT_31121 [Bipolaris zeicola 26-R-13]|uniref:FAD-binding FR-type domain-containing protein n=1 Tax=Cochliobolus carbonum (strain 26-R-13) TaxID=930089 RepID=W6XXD0_COCC2|nr:uncharacterized protein COCCADRAFT_31121 [Bipolaris zeicola 26-R-13]EUC27394.1 hypothetical protein COCCADRAFT_31121 [Bipolaris zeicola 26-R-13]